MNPNLPKKKMVVYEVVERKEPEQPEPDRWYVGPIIFTIFFTPFFLWVIHQLNSTQ